MRDIENGRETGEERQDDALEALASPPLETQDRPRRLLPALVRISLVGGVLAVLAATVWSQLGSVEGAGIGERVQQVIGLARGSDWAPLIAVGLLTALNVAGVPLMVLTAGVTVVFDSLALGFILSWTSSMAGAILGFLIGRWSGGSVLRDFGGDRINALSARLGRRGILVCFLIRLVPTAPAIIVNMAIGASHIPFVKFLLGTSLGIAPKLAFIAVVTKGLLDLDTDQGPYIFIGLAILIIFWFATMALARRLVRSATSGPESGS